MPNVTVQSAHAQTVALAYDSPANAALAQHVANAIQAGIGTSIAPADSAFGNPPPLFGKVGEWVQDTSGLVTIPKGYDYIVDAAPVTTLIDQNPDAGQAVLAGSDSMLFNASGSGSVIAGGGNDQVIIPVTDTVAGGWFIAMGNGNDTIRALNAGADTISVGAGMDSIQLGAGSYAVTTGGAATITASTGSETVVGLGSNVIFAMGSSLKFVAAGGATVFGGTGSATVTGGGGPDYFQGGTAGGNVLRAGSGAATLLGGGSGDSLFANGGGAQILYAGSGNETLTGSSVSGAADTFVGSAGATTVIASPSANNVFEFLGGSGTMQESGLTDVSQIAVHLAPGLTVATQTVTGPGLNVTLSDSTQITFLNISSKLTAGNFV